MLEETGDLWKCHERGDWVCVTTNGMRKRDGSAVMGAGVAKAAADRYPLLPPRLGFYLEKYGNRLFIFWNKKIITFPTKHNWQNPSDIELIKKSARELMEWLNKNPSVRRVCLPRPGCKNGHLEWRHVKLQIAPILDDRVVIVNIAP